MAHLDYDACSLTEDEQPSLSQLSERGFDKILHAGVVDEYPRVFAHFARSLAHEHFRPDLKPNVERLLSKAA